MRIKWYITDIMREIKQDFRNALDATCCGNEIKRARYYNEGRGLFHGLYTALLDTDFHTAKLFYRWYFRELENFLNAETQARRERLEQEK